MDGQSPRLSSLNKGQMHFSIKQTNSISYIPMKTLLLASHLLALSLMSTSLTSSSHYKSLKTFLCLKEVAVSK